MKQINNLQCIYLNTSFKKLLFMYKNKNRKLISKIGFKKEKRKRIRGMYS